MHAVRQVQLCFVSPAYRLENFQVIAALDVFQQLALFFDGGLLPGFDGLGPGHGFLGFGALQRPPALHIVHLQGVMAQLPTLSGIGPLSFFFCCFLQSGDLLFQLLVFRQLEGIPPLLISKSLLNSKPPMANPWKQMAQQLPMGVTFISAAPTVLW